MNAAKFLQLYLSISLVFVGNIIIPAMELNLLSYISKLKKRNSMSFNFCDSISALLEFLSVSEMW